MEKCAVSLYGYCFFLKNAKALFVLEIVFSADFKTFLVDKIKTDKASEKINNPLAFSMLFRLHIL